MNSLEDLKMELRKFTAERDWEQFHTPKNLCCALAVETSELLEHYQWKPDAETHPANGAEKLAIALEMADVLIYLVRLADQLQIDLLDAAAKKLEVNAARYPIDRSRGTSKKYTEL